MATAEQAKPNTRERKLLESESRWLQKALFALSKADDDRVKLADSNTGLGEDLTVQIGGKTFSLSDVNEAVRETVDDRMEILRAALLEARRPAIG